MTHLRYRVARGFAGDAEAEQQVRQVAQAGR